MENTTPTLTPPPKLISVQEKQQLNTGEKLTREKPSGMEDRQESWGCSKHWEKHVVPHEEKLCLEEFEASGALRVTTATANTKLLIR